MKARILLLAMFCCFLTIPTALFAQGTAFTYQGQVMSSNSPAHGTYDVTFKLWNASSGGSQVGSTITATGTVVTNGLFTVVLDFGGGIFTGTSYWLELGVRTNGVVSFTTLAPRQQLTPTPYAITAENVDGAVPASQLTGTLPSTVLSGTYGNPINLNNPGNNVSGNGSGLTGLNASQLTSGTVSDARLSANVAFLHTNQTFTGTNIFASGGGVGRLIVSNTFVAVDTSLFTGLSFQYDANFGEGALMSSYNDGTAYLSFYTKAFSGQPITKQVIIDAYGVLGVDQANKNGGFLNNSTLSGAGLVFGSSSGEGIASKRTAGGNQFGLDFYTAFSNRMSIANSGNVGIGTLNPGVVLDIHGTQNLSTFSDGIVNIGDTATYHVSLDDNEIHGRYGTNVSALFINDFGGTVYIGSGEIIVDPNNSVSVNNDLNVYGNVNAYGNVNIYSAIHVPGAGVGTGGAAFVHVATAGNSLGNYTIINNPLCNGDPNAILMVTPNLNPGNTLHVYNNHPIGVWYNGSSWTIFEQDVATVPLNAAFNVLVIKN